MTMTDEELEALLKAGERLDSYVSCDGDRIEQRVWSYDKEAGPTEAGHGRYVYGANGTRVIGIIKHVEDGELLKAAPALLRDLIEARRLLREANLALMCDLNTEEESETRDRIRAFLDGEG